MSTDSHVLVTGAAGFVGSHLVDRLLADGYTVTGYDNFSSGHRRWLEDAFKHPAFTFVEADTLDLDTLTTTMQGHDLVFHLSANGDIAAAVQNPRLDVDQGILATFNVLTAMRATGASRLVFTSSGSVFGITDQVPTPETIGPLLPMSLYAAGKVGAEALISACCHTFGYRAWIYRFGNVVGGRMTRGVTHDFIHKLRGNPDTLEILGDGQQEKSYILVEEIVDGMLYGLANADVAPCDVFNLSHPETILVDEIARVIVAEMGLPNVTYTYTGGRSGWPGDQYLAKLDVDKMKALGWAAQHSSKDAVRIATQRLLQQDI